MLVLGAVAGDTVGQLQATHCQMSGNRIAVRPVCHHILVTGLTFNRVEPY